MQPSEIAKVGAGLLVGGTLSLLFGIYILMIPIYVIGYLYGMI